MPEIPGHPERSVDPYWAVRDKIEPLLHAFLGIKNPEEIEPVLLITSESVWEFPPGVWPNPEAVLIEPGVDTTQKEQYIWGIFQPIADALRLKQWEDPYHVLVDFCNGLIQEDEKRLYRERMGYFDARAILPPQRVIEDMVHRWSSRYTTWTSSPELVSYIESQLA